MKDDGTLENRTLEGETWQPVPPIIYGGNSTDGLAGLRSCSLCSSSQAAGQTDEERAIATARHILSRSWPASPLSPRTSKPFGLRWRRPTGLPKGLAQRLGWRR